LSSLPPSVEVAMNKQVDAMKKELLRDKKPKKEVVKTKDFLSSGYTPLNLAVSGRVKGAFHKGKYYHVFGDSDSGKTWATLTCFAEAVRDPEFKDYRLIFDAPEDGYAGIPLKKFFGEEVYDRIEPPQGTRDDPIMSQTTEDFYYNMDDALSSGRPCIYVLDSMDALDSKADQQKFSDHKKARRREQKTGKASKEAGSFGMAKAKANTSGMRVVFNKLKKSRSILIIISQAREDMGFGFVPTKTWSGGRALKFYCHAQILTQPVKTFRVPVGKKKYDQGILVSAKVMKNRHTGRKMTVRMPIYWSHGIDEVGGCIDYLLEQGHWSKAKGVISATEFGVRLKREELIRYVEEQDLEPELRKVVGDLWEQIRLACSVQRKKRYP
jgi:RecA/RadA recombinase